MGGIVIDAAKAVQYTNAGTFEFLMDRDGRFYFMEANTRLQVEHPVTEMITGVDLVELMIRSAAGEKLPFKQSDVKLNGWAVESRVYAEDPFRNFLPSIGRLVKYRPPAEAEIGDITVRNDTGVEEGGEISMFYDPMIAKLVTHGPTRIAAIDAQADALDAFYIDGIQHNVPFVSALMHHPRWREGRLSTGFIKEEYPEGFKPREAKGKERAVLVAVAATIDHLSNERRRAISHQMSGTPVGFAKRRVVKLGDEYQKVQISATAGAQLEVGFLDAAGKVVETVSAVSTWRPGDPVWHGDVGGQRVAVQIRPILNGAVLSYRGIQAPVHVYTEREAELAALMPVKAAADMSKFLLCPMPGLVKAIHVAEGQEVKAGDNLAIVEAMKMENLLRAERDGTVKKINAKAGDSLAVDAVILEFA
jgi:propionyl-CoA carboxylase alpha chain